MKINKLVIRAGLRAARPVFASHRISVNAKREIYDAFTATARPPKGTRFDRIIIAGVPVERVRPPGGN